MPFPDLSRTLRQKVLWGTVLSPSRTAAVDSLQIVWRRGERHELTDWNLWFQAYGLLLQTGDRSPPRAASQREVSCRQSRVGSDCQRRVVKGGEPTRCGAGTQHRQVGVDTAHMPYHPQAEKILSDPSIFPSRKVSWPLGEDSI